MRKSNGRKFRVCLVCKVDAEHSLISDGKPSGRCMSCQRVYSRAHYAANKRKHIEKRNAWRIIYKEEQRKVVRDLKKPPCTDCKVSYPYYVMHFDHRDPTKKEFAVSSVIGNISNERLFAEIAKCDLVCANCHAERTYRQRL